MKKFGIATKAIISDEKDCYLILHKSSEEEVNPNEADIPGGRVEFGEDLEAGLIREVLEETGLNIRIKSPTRTWSLVKEDLHLVGITFLAEVVEFKEVILSNEHSGYKWLKKEEIMLGEYPAWLKKEFEQIINPS